MQRKQIISLDGKIKIKYSDIQNVCMTSSIYALLQYLLLFDDDTVIHKTCYMVGNAVNEEISSKLPAIHFQGKQTGTLWTPSRWLYKLYLRLSRDIRFPFLKRTKIYGHDMGFLAPLIGKRDYFFLSDGPLCMSQNMQENSAEYQRQLRKHRTLTGRMEGFLYGKVAIWTWGNNDQCKEFYMTEENRSVSFKDKPVHIRSLKEMWDESSNEKKQFIQYVFNVTKEDLTLLKSKNLMFLTQPMIKDGILSENEYIDVLNNIFSRYDTSQMLLKLHPRDDFDYKKHFPKIDVYSKPVNMQLLVLLGTNVERAITICSSSVNSFPESVEVDWFGVGLHPKLEKYFGTPVPPYRRHNTCQRLTKH
ncbi:MAG: glycosyltransferase family 52 protein [Bacteroidales bacterium]|nr:glycosyltransferase family 52 protein [Bacteroidales bacterium]